MRPQMQPKSDLSVLLRDTPEAYYWSGFLLADGSVVRNGRLLKLVISNVDRAHILAFKQFIGCAGKLREQQRVPPHSNTVGIACMNSKLVPEWCHKFDVNRAKTYNPPTKLPTDNVDLLLAMFIGFIDGDGHVAKVHNGNNCNIVIHIHSSWCVYLNKMLRVVYAAAGAPAVPAKIAADGYTLACISRISVVRYLKETSIKLKLPTLARKWDKIDLTYVSRTEISRERVRAVRTYCKQGYTLNEISHKTGVGYSGIHQLVRRHNIKFNNQKPRRN